MYVPLILKSEPPADEEEGSTISFTCVVRFNEWVYNHGKSSVTTLSEPRKKKKYKTAFPFDKCPICSGSPDVRSVTRCLSTGLGAQSVPLVFVFSV